MIKVGDTAPGFTLASTTGQNRSLLDFRGKKVVLFFYPKDETPGCTREACGFRDHYGAITQAGAEVVGISKDSLASHDKFQANHGLPFELLTDPDNAVATQFGAFGEKKMYGRSVMGTIRSTFLIDEQGRIEEIWSPVRVDGHVEKVAEALGVKTVTKTVAKKKVAKKKVAKKKVAKKKVAKKKATKRTVKKATPAKKTAKKKLTARKPAAKKAVRKKSTARR